MSDEPAGEAPAAAAAPKRGMFRKAAARLSPDGVERQSRVTLLAWNLLGADAAIAFLNSYNDALEGRPLDLAVASADGCEAVERAITARATGE
ncbi:hypothetical protein FHR20_000011 [Sphingomonas leidyi]|uniref:DUF2384 domain-containing protein n=1 Tax=Sphingomonas leidyi TaxID=68569 RepID=A0A7X5UVI1_9SPHN|nr:antitoxin Xre/MbcA/ParS toxin-binding domain-containing protein [Sphingomonas leidyi]NIJ63080.1 hypothetical protein [Sphingomonas leidyi]